MKLIANSAQSLKRRDCTLAVGADRQTQGINDDVLRLYSEAVL